MSKSNGEKRELDSPFLKNLNSLSYVVILNASRYYTKKNSTRRIERYGSILHNGEVNMISLERYITEECV